MSITSSTIGKRTYKIVLMGDSSTGKTSIIERFVNNKFEERDNPTIGIDFLGKNVTHNATTCRLQLWDTAGQERYRSLIPSYLKDAICAVFVFDLARPETLAALPAWVELFRDNKGEKSVMAVCGNKSDLVKDYDRKQLAQLLDKYKMKYYEASALTAHNVEHMFFSLIDDITLLHQARRKKNAEEDSDFHAPLTTDNLKSERITARCSAVSSENGEQKVELQEGSKGRTCCSG